LPVFYQAKFYYRLKLDINRKHAMVKFLAICSESPWQNVRDEHQLSLLLWLEDGSAGPPQWVGLVFQSQADGSTSSAGRRSYLGSVLRIRLRILIWIRRIRMFLGNLYPDPDPFVRGYGSGSGSGSGSSRKTFF
jgi:hypothetical protein